MRSRLRLYLLGPPRVECDGLPVDIDRRKALALLAYLAVTGKPHRRDALVYLLWPEYDSGRGRAALRRTLFALRQALPDGCLDAARDEIGIDPGLEIWVDVHQFYQHLAECEAHGHPAGQPCPACVEPLTEAVVLAQGEFLSGFGLKDTFSFDDWQLFQAEELRQALSGALERLVHWHTTQREFELALGYARRQLALDPLDEAAHRQLMRLHAWSGRRSAALQQYEECLSILEDQLGVPPQETTTELYHAIKKGQTPAPPALSSPPVEQAQTELPSFLQAERAIERPVFVARERELTELDRHLETALAGQGHAVFVTGGAGSGKTALLQEFARRAQATHPDLIVAWGHGNAHTGVGDPYLPFREILGLLAGDIEAQWAAGAMSQEQTRRLWQLLPLTVKALLRDGRDLLDLFVPAAPLLERAQIAGIQALDPSIIPQPENAVARRMTRIGDSADARSIPVLQQSALFDQYTRVLHALCQKAPLVLVLDDLQWADIGSTNLLFHFGRQLPGKRILIVGAYRAEEIAIGRDEQRHPLEPVIAELQRQFGQIVVDVDQADGGEFVEALLDSEPNKLGTAFRDALLRHGQGHPLFTVELLRGLQERGDLARDSQGHWTEATGLDWETLPARVEAVLAERIGRLPQALRDTLTIAAVEGETFTAEVVSRLQRIGKRELVHSLSEILDRRHRLVAAHGIQRLGAQRLSRYRFCHNLYQKYLSYSLDPVERAYLHEEVASALESLYTSADQDVSSIALQLAWHYEEAGVAERAIENLRKAGESALRLSAYEEGIAHLRHGLDLLMRLPASPQRDSQELALRLAVGKAWVTRGTPIPEVKETYSRARVLCEESRRSSYLSGVLGQLSIVYYVRAEYSRALELAEEALSLALEGTDPLLVATGHWHLGFITFALGQYHTARDHLQHVISAYDPAQHHLPFLALRGSDAGISAMAYDACCLWCLGYPDQALELSWQTLALASDLDHPMSTADALCYAGGAFNQMRRNAPALKENAEQLIQLAEGMGFPGWYSMGNCLRGEALVMLGRAREGMNLLQEHIAANEALDARCYIPGALRALAEAQAQAGQIGNALATVTAALDLVEKTGERHWEAELHRVQAQLLLAQNDEPRAEASLQKAVAVARQQRARSWELRATTDLARLWQAQGKVDQAHDALREVYSCFTEGFDTPDLQQAAALLEELA